MMLRLATGTVAAALLAAALHAAPASAETITARASAKVVKPLVLTSIQDLEFGTVLIGTGSWPGATLRLSRAGVLTCPAQLICSGLTRVAQYNVAGSNNTTVRISAPDVTLVNQSDSTKTLTMAVDSPGSIMLTNSGAPGHNFPLGGSIQLNSTTANGTYTGTFNVTVDY